MRKSSDAIFKQNAPAIIGEVSAPACGAFEVNVLFTDAQATAAALKSAASFARDLGGRICLRAGVVVPWQLPLDCPPISVEFLQQLLRRLAERLDRDVYDPTVQLYLCRNWMETLDRVLKPHSMVVIGERKRWWPTRASRVARALRARGHFVMLVDLKPRAAEAQ